MSYLKRAEKSGPRFLNPVSTVLGGPGMVFKVLPRYIVNRNETEPKAALGPFCTDVSRYAARPAGGLRVTWFGHSSLLVELDGVRVLIDPVWERRASPFQFMGPKRFFAPTLRLEELPRIDVVLVSHDHYDHLGAETARTLAGLPGLAGATWVTSLGVGRRLAGFGVATERIVELDWTESVEVKNAEGAGVRLTAWPSRHFSGRGVLDRFKTLWASYVLEGLTVEGQGHRVFYGADSGYWEGFAEIGARYGGFDLTMLEIGAFDELWSGIHLGPDGAARAFADLGGRGLLMPIHWGLFNLALHGWRQPVERVLAVAAESGIPLWLPRPGEPTEVVAGVALNSEWWV